MSNSELPSSLQYSASKASLRINRFQVRPNSTDSGGPGTNFRFNLPSKSLVDVSSLALAFDVTVSGLLNTDGNNYSNVKMPHGHKLFSSVKFYVGGQIVSGSLCTNTYDILYNTLVKASCGEDWVNSRMNSHAVELIRQGDDITALLAQPGATTKVASYIVDDFLGLPRGNGTGRSIIDTSLWGDVSIEVVMNNESAFAQYGLGAATGAVALGNMTYAISAMECYVNVITQTTPLYVKLLTMLISQKEGQIRFPYQNFITNVASSGSNARFQVNTNCLDAIVLAPLTQSYSYPHGVAGALTGPNITAATKLSSTRYEYDSGLNCDTLAGPKGRALSIQIGSETFPKLPIANALHVSDITNNSLFATSLYSQNLLFNDISAGGANGTVLYSRNAFLNENFIWVQSFSPDGEGWATKVLTGIDTQNNNLEIIVNHNAMTGTSNLFMGALITSMLVFDCASGSVSVVQ
jgi:hypothetical protein